jgi:ribonucleoside-diphosphate reductase alpha chain
MKYKSLADFSLYPSYTTTIDLSRDSLLSEQAVKTLREKYMSDNETSPQEAFARAACAFSDSEEMAQRIYDYVSKQWFMYASPILANGGTSRGLPISCFLNFVDDSIQGLVNNWTENLWLTTSGGGIGTYFGAVRSDGSKTSRGTKSTGVIPFMKTIETQMLAYSQGQNRRGAAAIYLDVSHPEIEEFVNMRRVGGGDIGRKIHAKEVWHHAVNVSDKFMRAVIAGEDWDLIDPNSKEVTRTISARDLWQRILETRMETGEPYIMFVDTVNRLMPWPLAAKGRSVSHSNLCSEITLPTDPDHTAVCCLSSVNLETWDEWKNDDKFISDLIQFLDNVLEYFIQKAPPALFRAVNSAKRERSLGLGTMGFHALLQRKNIPFESALAVSLNKKIFKQISDQAKTATIDLVEVLGREVPPDMEGVIARNSHLMAIAPNATSADIIGTSPSIEPYVSNAFSKRTNTGVFIRKNKYLEQVFEKYGRNNKQIWNSVTAHQGSVQHLDFLSDWEKDIFKTAFEIDQEWLIQHAADRQPYICQAQSLNLFLSATASKGLLHHLHKVAWQRGVKTLYYVRSSSAKAVEDISKKIERTKFDFENNTASSCLACEG